jgi:tetratricopeptide (TPR) repeat protein
MSGINLVLMMILLAFGLFGCSQNKKDAAFKVFNEGVSLSLDAGEHFEKGEDSLAFQKYEAAIQKFKQTIKIDSSHAGAASAIGFANYETRRFDEAETWFGKAIEMNQESAIDHQFMGLSKINLGDVVGGKASLERAHALDNSREMLNKTIENLRSIGELAFSYGEGYEQQGEPQKGIDYKKFGVSVLLTALSYDKGNHEVKELIRVYALKLNDPILTEWLKKN